jgi:type II secretory pathway component GspD/PulD (secretin)
VMLGVGSDQEIRHDATPLATLSSTSNKTDVSTAVTIASQAQVVLGGLADWKGSSSSPFFKTRPAPSSSRQRGSPRDS